MTATFTSSLLGKLLQSLDNYHTDNWEPRRGAPPPEVARTDVARRQGLHNDGFIKYGDIKDRALWFLDQLNGYIRELDATYDLLGDDASREAMVNHYAYHMLQHERVRLPKPGAQYETELQAIEAIAEDAPGVAMNMENRSVPLQRFDLTQWNIDAKIYARALGVYAIFLFQQYAYETEAEGIEAPVGGTVIDLGGSFGDSALYFATKVGETGQVYSFEFLPDSLETFRKNMGQNPDLAERITLVDRAVWSVTGERLYHGKFGTGTQVLSEPKDGCREEVLTLTVDDLVADKRLTVDFIKMDIEGAEIAALEGARDTILRDKPIIALSAYHKLDDPAVLPGFLISLDVGYRFYLAAANDFGSELVLFAIADQPMRTGHIGDAV